MSKEEQKQMELKYIKYLSILEEKMKVFFDEIGYEWETGYAKSLEEDFQKDNDALIMNENDICEYKDGKVSYREFFTLEKTLNDDPLFLYATYEELQSDENMDCEAKEISYDAQFTLSFSDEEGASIEESIHSIYHTIFPFTSEKEDPHRAKSRFKLFLRDNLAINGYYDQETNKWHNEIDYY